MDVPPVMGLITPNITNVALGGEYTIADFERIVRHGVRRDGSTSFMPAIDYERLSDREISDLFEYVVSAPAVDRPSGRSYWGPVLRVMYTLGSTPALSAHRIDHQASHPKTPPTRAVTVDYGRHLAQVCRGCHREDFRGGPMAEGDPSWPPAANLTPHESGLKTWTSADFVTLMRTGKRPDGRDVDPKGMPWPSLGKMDDVDLQALFVFLQSLSAQPTGT
jgi:mono/diheme cytochrome c family protein